VTVLQSRTEKYSGSTLWALESVVLPGFLVQGQCKQDHLQERPTAVQSRLLDRNRR